MTFRGHRWMTFRARVNARIAGIPEDLLLHLADLPTVRGSHERVRVDAMSVEGGFGGFIWDAAKDDHAGDAGRFVAVEFDRMVGADVMGQEVAQSPAPQFDEIVGAHDGGRVSAKVGIVSVNLIDETGTASWPILQVQRRGEADNGGANLVASYQILSFAQDVSSRQGLGFPSGLTARDLPHEIQHRLPSIARSKP